MQRRRKKFKTHYDNLRVKETASSEVIKGAYKSLVQKWHPDKNPHNKEKSERVTKIITKAYYVLSDPQRRKEHDEWIIEQRDGEDEFSESSPPPSPESEKPTDSEYSDQSLASRPASFLLKVGRLFGFFKRKSPPVTYAGGDGRTLEKAVIIQASSTIDGVLAERAWLAGRYPGSERIRKTLLHKNGRSYDLIEIHITNWEPVSNWKVIKIYFDISSFFGKF
jgi:curved DNA-binding protein CbpA